MGRTGRGDLNGCIMHRVHTSYSSCTDMSGANICSNNGGAQERGKRGSKEDETGAFLSFTALMLTGFMVLGFFRVLFCNFFLISPSIGPNSGF
jgi:hypothetical protein